MSFPDCDPADGGVANRFEHHGRLAERSPAGAASCPRALRRRARTITPLTATEDLPGRALNEGADRGRVVLVDYEIADLMAGDGAVLRLGGGALRC